MKVVSRWKMVFDPGGSPRTLIDFGDLMETELEWKLDKAVEVVDIVGGTAPFIRPMGNNVYTIEFTAFVTNSEDQWARRGMLDTLASVDDLAKKPLRITLATETGAISGFYYQFANAIIRSFSTVRIMEGAKVRTAYRYAITATSLTKVTT